ncbi:C40 family peptidase [Gabonibacter chumensis]|uniref:C40 family peptidase n=1 Tax=Gabonibacter chumensis TaxID=2972474 RepID=UPI00257381C0|nr:NlpC/P60 family protein [Gabonibacter chumensis]MCR9012639.1 NlpC/P60 family protein [Gabonibacter chumensis]
MRYVLFIGFLFIWATFSSCGTSRQLASNKQQRAQLSRKLGFTVNRKDDLRLFEEVTTWLRVPYRYGGTTRTGVDCSGFVGAVYKNVYHKKLERTVAHIFQKDCRRIGKHKLKSGDLLFFTLSKKKKKRLTHMGIFLKNGYFAHASVSKGVIISHLSDPYYKKGWKKSGRVW